ncbi:MAG: LiaF domain-containing protein [Actinomycetota bacterium]
MSAGRSLVGGALMALGAIFLLEAAGVVEAGGLVGKWWPGLFLALGVMQAFSEKRVGAVAVVLVVGGALLLTVSTGLLGSTAWAVTWPILVVLAGAWLLSGWGRQRRSACLDPEFSRLSVFNSVRVASRATALRRVALTAVFGKLRLDLTGAHLDPAGARLSATSVFGHIDVIVPEGWAVEVRGLPIAGAWDDTVSRRGVGPQSPRLNVRVLVVIGGVELKHKPRWG